MVIIIIMSAMEIADVYLHGESPIIIDNQLDLFMYLTFRKKKFLGG